MARQPENRPEPEIGSEIGSGDAPRPRGRRRTGALRRAGDEGLDPEQPGRNAERASPAPASPDSGGTHGDLLSRFREGDAAAFDELVRTFEDRLVQFFYRLCWDRSRAEDLTQMLFLKLLRGSVRYRPEGKLATYVFRVATNLWIDHYRGSRHDAQIASLDQVLVQAGPIDREAAFGRPAEVGPVAAAEANEEAAILRDAVERLTRPHRLVFELAVLQQLSYAEVSEILEIPVGTVKSRMHNTVRALRELMGAAREDGRGRAGFRGAGARDTRVEGRSGRAGTARGRVG